MLHTTMNITTQIDIRQFRARFWASAQAYFDVACGVEWKRSVHVSREAGSGYFI
jgi:hypothetical protein